MSRPLDRVRVTVSGNPGLGNITVSSAVDSTWLTFAAAGAVTGETFDILIEQGADREIQPAMAYNAGTGVLTRGTPSFSSTGSPLTLTSAAIVSVVLLAASFDPLPLRKPAPAPSSAGSISIGNTASGERDALVIASATWPKEWMQGSLARQGRKSVRAISNSTNLELASIVGSAFTSLTTVTQRGYATTNMATRALRVGYVSAATAGAVTGGYTASTGFLCNAIGDGSGGGGFRASFLFIPSDPATVSGARMFGGMSSSIAAPTNVDPASLTNVIGVAQLASSTNLQIVYGGSAAQTPIDLGANFPASGATADIYAVELFASPNNTNIIYRVERLNTGDVASGTLTNTTPGTTLPATTTFLGPRIWRTNNATALAVAVDLCAITIETPV